MKLLLDTHVWIWRITASRALEARAEALCRFHDVDDMIESLVGEHVEAIVELGLAYPVGTVLERRGDLVFARSARSAA